MDFNPKERLAITKSIIELTGPSGSYSLAEHRSRHSNRIEDGVVMFYVNERRDLTSIETAL